MLLTTLRRTTIALGCRSAVNPTCYTSWVVFEQPNPRVYTAFDKDATKAVGPPGVPGATLKQETTDVRSGQGYVPIKMAAPFDASSVKSEALYVRPFTNFRHGPWRDNYLPNLRLNIPGSPVTFGIVNEASSQAPSDPYFTRNPMSRLEDSNITESTWKAPRSLPATHPTAQFKNEFETVRDEGRLDIESWHKTNGDDDGEGVIGVMKEKVTVDKAATKTVWQNDEIKLRDQA